MMMEMKEKCSECKEMMGGQRMMKEGAEGGPKETLEPAAASEHEAHH